MDVFKERFRRIRVTDKGPGRLLFVIMTTTGLFTSGMLEAMSRSVPQSVNTLSENNHTNEQGRRYCDPPNMTNVYYDFSGEASDDYPMSQHQETTAENSAFWMDMEKEKAGIYIQWALTLSFVPACFLTSKYGASNVFSLTFLWLTIFSYIQTEMKFIKDIYAIISMVFLYFSFYQMAFNFAFSSRNSLISFASVRIIGLALGESYVLLSLKLHHTLYIITAIMTIWFIFWWKIQFTSSRTEVYYQGQNRRKSKLQTPWKDILKSRPVWMTIAVIFGASCGRSCIYKGMRWYLQYIYFLKTETIYHINIISSLLHFGFAISCGFSIDYLIRARIVSVTSSRRMIVYLSHFIPAGLLFVIGFVGCAVTTPIVLYCLSIMMTGANYTGAFSSPLDLAPKYSGPILALCFSFSLLGETLMDHLMLYILTNQVFVSWRFIFSLNSLILLLTAIFFMLRGSGSVQPWNDPNDKVNKCIQQEKVSAAPTVPKPRTKSIYMVEKKILKVLHVQEPDKFTRVRAYSTSLPNERINSNPPNIYRPSNKKRASIS